LATQSYERFKRTLEQHRREKQSPPPSLDPTDP